MGRTLRSWVIFLGTGILLASTASAELAERNSSSRFGSESRAANGLVISASSQTPSQDPSRASENLGALIDSCRPADQTIQARMQHMLCCNRISKTLDQRLASPFLVACVEGRADFNPERVVRISRIHRDIRHSSNPPGASVTLIVEGRVEGASANEFGVNTPLAGAILRAIRGTGTYSSCNLPNAFNESRDNSLIPIVPEGKFRASVVFSCPRDSVN